MLASLADAAFPVLVDAAWKGTILLAFAFILARSLHRARAAYRHAVWALTMLGLLAIPVASYLLPSWQLPLIMPAFAEAAPAAPTALDRNLLAMANAREVLPPEPKQAVPGEQAALINEASPDVAAPASDSRMATAIVFTWLIGATLSALWLFAGIVCVTGLARRCRFLETVSLQTALAEIADHLGIRRHLRPLLSAERTMPMTWGVLRPTVLLPEEAQTWSQERLRLVLTHELGHVQRWDCVTHLLGQLARGLYWFHPLAWLALRGLRREQENACDDLVLACGANAPDYAEHLLAVTVGLQAGFWHTPLALAFGQEDRLKRRLETLLDGGRTHLPPRRRALLGAVTVALALVLSVGTAAIALTPGSARADGQEEEPEAQAAQESDLAKKLSEVRDKLAEHYVAPLDDKALTEQALKGLLQGLKDPYTDYLSADDLKQVDSQIKGNVSGIGAQLGMVGGRLTVTTPLEDSPALKAGLRPGDQIEAIDGKATRGSSMDEAVQRLRGPAGSVVRLKVAHPEGVVEELAVTRGDVRLRSVSGFRRGVDGRWQFMLDGERKIGYVHVAHFARGTAVEVREAVQGLQKEGLKGLILDLRFCPGGLLDQALEVSKLFIADGVIVTIRGPNKQEMVYRADGKATLGDFPIIVLVNEQTASAAEIVAGALRDHGRATLIGTRTFGKGSVQTLVNLKDGGALRMTTAHHYLPSGRNIQKLPGEAMWGVDPSEGFYLPLDDKQTTALRQDAQKRALVELKKGDSSGQTALTPKLIEEQHADPQLAAALRSIVGRVTGGEFLKVGAAAGPGADQALRLEELRQRRGKLQQNINQIDRDMAELQRLQGTDRKNAK